MTMDDTFAFYAAGAPATGLEDVVVKGFVNYGYTSALAIGYGGAPPIKHVRFEDVHFVTNQNKFAIWIQFTPAYFTGRGYLRGPSEQAALWTTSASSTARSRTTAGRSTSTAAIRR